LHRCCSDRVGRPASTVRTRGVTAGGMTRRNDQAYLARAGDPPIRSHRRVAALARRGSDQDILEPLETVLAVAPELRVRLSVDVVDVVVGAVIGTIIGWMGKEFLPTLWRRIQGRPPVIVHIETNPAIFEAGLPPWIGYGFVFPRQMRLGPPPRGPCQEWSAWAKDQGGVDASTTKLRLTVVGDDRATVLVDALQVTIMNQGDVLDGQYVLCPAPGGADIMTRHIAVDLDGFAQPTTRYVTDGSSTGRFAFQLAPGAGGGVQY
jgi:hypothetical protein